MLVDMQIRGLECIEKLNLVHTSFGWYDGRNKDSSMRVNVGASFV
jgi:hypothetical protein